MQGLKDEQISFMSWSMILILLRSCRIALVILWFNLHTENARLNFLNWIFWESLSFPDSRCIFLIRGRFKLLWVMQLYGSNPCSASILTVKRCSPAPAMVNNLYHFTGFWHHFCNGPRNSFCKLLYDM